MTMRSAILSLLIGLAAGMSALAQDARKPSAQNPSPMSESARSHTRLRQENLAGARLKIDSILPTPVEIFVPARNEIKKRLRLLIQFHGASFISERTVVGLKGNAVAASVNLGSGSRVYGDAFRDPRTFPQLLDAVEKSLQQHFGTKPAIASVILSGFSAGYGAIRAILGESGSWERVDAVLLLDGLHAGYLPEGRVLAEGGQINPQDLSVFLKLAQDCSRKQSRKRFLITHSEIFPGTFVSTTEASDYVLEKLGLRRRAELAWGPNGMQLPSYARINHFEVLGFAGNTAPDHIDHLHGMEYFVRRLMKL
jgi:hypothetical protein